MAKTIPAEFNLVDSNTQFIPGTQYIDGDPADALATLDPNVRWLWANFKAENVAVLSWYDGEGPENLGVSAVFDADPDLKILIPKDDAFDTLRVRIDYAANVAHAEGFKLTLAGLDHFFATVAAGGADRAVIRTIPAALSGKGYEGIHEALLYIKAGTPANAVKSITIERVAPAGAIPDGSQYGGTFVPPDDEEIGADKPLTPTKIYGLIQAAESLRLYRKRAVLNYSAPLRGTTVNYNWTYVDNRGIVQNNTALLGGMYPLVFKGFDSDRAANCYYQLNAAQAINAHGGETDNPQNTTRLVPVAPFVDVVFDDALTIKAETPADVQQWAEIKIAPEIDMSWLDAFIVVGV